MTAIPPMTDPLSRYWRQPKDIRDAEMDKEHVLLTADQFAGLHEYSTSVPTGAYEGKCWKRQQTNGWLLCWYGESPDDRPDLVTIHFRGILIA